LAEQYRSTSGSVGHKVRPVRAGSVIAFICDMVICV
jgi:hypothetical protein